MATYFCRMSVKTKTHGASAVAVFDYNCREGKYSKRQEELVLHESGNMPEFAKSPKDFWQSADTHDVRSYRKIDFSLPNELSREAQLEIVREYVQEVCGDKPYTFAIHEVESAVYGEKNPHCHLMFSERIIDDRVRNMSEEDFFKKRGKSKSGLEYGGSIKDRRYAGNRSTTAIYEVREALANITNRVYEKHGLSVRISADSLEDQNEGELKKGNAEGVKPKMNVTPYLDRKTFQLYRHQIKEAVLHQEHPDELDVPNKVKARILYEQERMIISEIKKKIDEHNIALTQTKKDLLVVHAKLFSERQEMYKEWLKGNKKDVTSPLFDALKTQPTISPNEEVSVYSEANARLNLADMESLYFKNQQQKEKALADQILLIREVNKAINQLKKESKESLIEAYIDDQTQGVYSRLQKAIVVNTNLKKHHEKNNNIEGIKRADDALQALMKDTKTLFDNYITNDTEAEFIYKEQQIQHRLHTLYRVKESLQEFKQNLEDHMTNIEKETATKKAISKERVSHKHTVRKGQIQGVRDKQVDTMYMSYKKTYKSKESIRREVIDEVSNGELKRLEGQLRSKKSLLTYHETKTLDAVKIQETKKEVKALEQAIQTLYIKHGTNDVEAMVRARYTEHMQKVKPKLKQDMDRLQRIQKPMLFGTVTANKANHLLALMKHYADPNKKGSSSGLYAASFKIDERDGLNEIR